MKPEIHPAYGPVAFRDRSTGTMVLTGSARAGRTDLPTIEVEGSTYPRIDVDVTSDSYPFWTGAQHTLDSEGRVEAFKRRYGQKR